MASAIQYPTDEEFSSALSSQPSSGINKIVYPTDEEFSSLVAKPESGFWAHLKKSFSDAYDYISLSSLGLDGAEGNEEEIARIVAETTRRQDEVAKSAQHQYLLDVVGRESKDVKDAEGFANTSLAVLDAAGKTIWTAVTNPLGVAEFGASQAGNMAVAVGGMFAGALAGIPGGPAGIAIGSRLGALSGGASVETGAAYIEALMKAGIDVTNQAAVQKAISDPEFQREMYKKGYTKGLTIGIVDAAFMGLSKLPGTGAGRELRKDLLKEGIDIKKNADWEKIAVRHAEGDEVVTAAFKKYADAPRAKAIGTKKMAIETTGEGVSEGLGGLAAFGETSFEDIALEMLGSTAQSGVQAAVSASLSGSKQLLQKATKESLRQQADAVHKGKASGIEPEELNEALRRQKDGVSAQLDTVSEPIAAFEEDIGKADNAQSVVDSLRTALTLEGFANYRLSLQTALQTEDAYPNGVMPFYVALTKEEQATLASGGSLSAPIKGSLSRGKVSARKGKTDKKGQNFGGQDVVLVKVPVSSVIMRGNWDNVELVVAPNGMQLAAVPQTPQQTETKPILSQKLEQEADRLARQDVETTLDTEVEIGELETQATDRSKKDVDLDTREATDKAARKLAQLREPDNYETVSQLQGALDRNKIPLFPGQRRKRPPLALALQNYRKALTKPNSADAINDVLAPTGYKLSKKADGVHLIPIDNKPALRVPNTGNREVGQSTVDDYLFWINEGQATKAPETTEKKQAALKKEAAQVEARKPPRENVQSIIDSIENNFVTRDGDKITVDEEGLSDILAQAGNIADWSKADKGRLNQYVRSIRTEQELQTPTKKAPVKGTTITVPQSAGALTSLESSFKRTGKSKFIERVRKLLTNKKGNDALLAEIAKAYRKANPGKADGDLASILTLTGKADQANIAKAYALAQMLITLRPSVSTIRPDTTLAIEDGNLSAFMRFDKVLDGVKENQLVGQIKQVFGEDSTYTRINDFEVVVTNPKLTPIQFARRFGRLRGKRNDIRKSELFTAQIETQTHDWTKDPSGESIRSEIRRLGFGSILQFVDDRRADYLDIAEEFGAKEVAQYRQAPRAPPQETTTEEDTESTDEVDFSLEGKTPGININDSSQPFTEQILSGEKTIETRDTDSLRPYVGKRVGIVRTGKGKATLVGYATIGKPTVYRTEEGFRVDERKHLIEKGSPFDIEDTKYGYPLTDVTRVSPQEVTTKGIVAREVPAENTVQTIESQIRDIEAQIAELDPESESGLIEELIFQRNFLLEEEDGPMFSLVGKIKGLVKPGVSGSGHISRRPLLIRNLKSVPKDADIREGVARFVSTDRGATIEYRTWDGNSWVSFRPDRVSLELTEVEENFINGLGSVENREMQEVAPSLAVRYGEGADPTVLYVDRDEVVRLAQHLSTFTKEDGVPPRFANTSWLVKIKDADVEAQTDEGPLFSLGSTSGLSRKSRTTWTRLRKTPNQTKRTVSEVGVALTEHYRKVYGKPLDLTNPEDYKLAANILAAEMKYQLQEDSTGEGWYSEDVAEAYKITQEIISNIKDRDLSIIHAFISSITSIDKMVDVNWRNATLISKIYSETGTITFRDFLTKGQFGYPVMAQQLRMLNNLLIDWGPERVAKWLLEEHTVRELNSVRKEYGGLGKQAELIGGADAIFLGSDVIGPKTGTFFKNIMGISDAESLTIDKWATRTINRIIGRMVEEKHGPWTGKLSDQGLIDSPRSPAERALFKSLFVDAGKRNGLIKTRDDGKLDFTDSQAVPWFFEQQLFTALGATSTPLGFSDGARKALREYNEGKIPDDFSPDSVQQGNATAVREILSLVLKQTAS
jgi:hypothetical protein